VCGQAGISGSTEIGTGVVLAGQVGLAGHIRIGNNSKVGAKSGVLRDLEDGSTVIGYPAIERRQWLKNSAAFQKLAELAKEVRQLKEKLDSLEHGVAR
jgi:UDP-3-O-[3-hydroxymyristoyl] glucosamine N-acyltransferase